MSLDITSILRDWPFEHGQISARLVEGDDGEPRVQVRLDLGLIQMAVDGRPDGTRPFGYPSLLEYYEARADESSQPDDVREPPVADVQEPEPGDSTESDEPTSEFSLSPEDCRLLREEAVQFYHRYLALLVLEDFDRVVRDTTRNLRLLDFIAAHAHRDEDRDALDQFRPYLLMMRTRAMASQAVKDNEPKAAILAIDEGFDSIREHFASIGHPELFEQAGEVEALRSMRDALIPKLPMSQGSELRARLARALEQENYELAAILRDELRQLKDGRP